MKIRDIISSIFWLTMGIRVCYGGYNLEIETLKDPDSGFILFWVGIIMIGLSLGVLIRTMRETATPSAALLFRLQRQGVGHELYRTAWTQLMINLLQEEISYGF